VKREKGKKKGGKEYRISNKESVFLSRVLYQVALIE
jgi:hypothetical protein